jgi:hypothetical protein
MFWATYREWLFCLNAWVQAALNYEDEMLKEPRSSTRGSIYKLPTIHPSQKPYLQFQLCNPQIG